MSAEAAKITRLRRMLTSGDARTIRETAGLSVRVVADELDVHHTTVSRWETGDTTPQRGHALAYLALLEQLVDEATRDNGAINEALQQIGTRVRRDGMLCPRCTRRYVQASSERGLCGWCDEDQDKIERESKRRYARRKARE